MACEACCEPSSALIRPCCCPIRLCIACFRRHVRYCAFLDNPATWSVPTGSEDNPSQIDLDDTHLSILDTATQDKADAWIQVEAKPRLPPAVKSSTSRAKEQPSLSPSSETARLLFVSGAHLDIQVLAVADWLLPSFLGKARELAQGYAYNHNFKKGLLTSVAPREKVLAAKDGDVYEVFWSILGSWRYLHFLANVLEFHQLTPRSYLLSTKDVGPMRLTLDENGNWKAKAVRNVTLFPGTAIAYSGTRLYAIGGSSLISKTPIKMVQSMELEKGGRSGGGYLRTNYPLGVTGAAAAVFKGRLIVTGGITAAQNKVTKVAFFRHKDRQNWRWDPFPSLNLARENHLLVVHNDELLAIGGRGPDPRVGRSLERLHRNWDRWLLVPNALAFHVVRPSTVLTFYPKADGTVPM